MEAENGKIMLVRYENTSTLKRVVKKAEKTYLCWEDGTDKQIQVDSEDYEVQSVLTWITKAPGK
ncbi:hypothetical protein FACS1894147_06690 [Spirochaetia bacterium]|nr:hypothetical protein FACS1894147_06690 [Spirochaetia bacterium]